MSTGERIESIKAGILAAIAFACAYSLTTLLNGLLFSHLFSSVSSFVLIAREAIALSSGFLFGVTYRYLIRYNENPHLKDGIIFAFALVRGLALGEIVESFTSLLMIIAMESVFAFALTRFTLDFAFAKNWISK